PRHPTATPDRAFGRALRHSATTNGVSHAAIPPLRETARPCFAPVPHVVTPRITLEPTTGLAFIKGIPHHESSQTVRILRSPAVEGRTRALRRDHRSLGRIHHDHVARRRQTKPPSRH